MTNFEGWDRLCDKNHCDIYPISVATNQPNTGLYMTKGWYWDSNHRNRYYDDPMYQIWVDDERELVTMNANEAAKHWEGLVKEHNFEVENFEQIDMEV